MILTSLPKSYTEICVSGSKKYVRKHVLEIRGDEKRGYYGSYSWYGPYLLYISVYTSSGLKLEDMKAELLEALNKEINSDRSRYYDSVVYEFEY